jgi:hypothetical protein
LAAQTQFDKTRDELFNCADNLDRMAALADHQSEVPRFKQFAPLNDSSARTLALADHPLRASAAGWVEAASVAVMPGEREAVSSGPWRAENRLPDAFEIAPGVEMIHTSASASVANLLTVVG